MSIMMGRDRSLEFIPVTKIVANQKNPRSKKHFKSEELSALKASIKEHGILQPVLVQPRRDGPKEDHYELIEGERRYTVAKELGLKEIPAVIGGKLDDHEQLVTMYNVHTQFKGWEMAEQLRTIKELIERNGSKTEDEMAEELGMSIGTFRDRLRVLGMGDDVVADIATDKVKYASALRAVQVSASLKKKRPALVKKLGGEQAVQRKLVSKAKKGGKGISQELVESKRDLGDTSSVPDEVIEEYIKEPKLTLRDARKEQKSLEEKRATEDLARVLRNTEKAIQRFTADLADVPNLEELRDALRGLVDAAGDLELQVVEAISNGNDE